MDTITSLKPKTMYGWIGAALLGGALLYHRSLTMIGLGLTVAAGLYLYFVVDQS